MSHMSSDDDDDRYNAEGLIKRPSYIGCLLRLKDLLAAGLEALPADAADGYYKLVLVSKDLPSIKLELTADEVKGKLETYKVDARGIVLFDSALLLAGDLSDYEEDALPIIPVLPARPAHPMIMPPGEEGDDEEDVVMWGVEGEAEVELAGGPVFRLVMV